MFNSKVYWRVWIILGIFIFFIIAFIKGFEMNAALIMSAVSAAGISLTTEALLFKQIIWKKCPDVFYPWLCTIPYIGGIWEGEIEADYIFPDTGEKGLPIPAKLEIKHEFDKISIALETKKSFSSSYVSDIWVDEGGRKYLCFTYYNDADDNRDTNPNHDGTSKLRISRNDSGNLILVGHYFTGRRTTGKMIFERLSRKNASI